MKVITIIQPWATLIAIGEKRFETRSWKTNYRGDLAIHAGKKVDKKICREEPFLTVLQNHGYSADSLPSGLIIAKGRLANCYEVIHSNGEFAVLDGDQVIISGNEYLFGDYSEGRFAWELDHVELLKEPIPAKGQLGIWEYSF